MQISNGVSRDTHLLFTPDVEIVHARRKHGVIFISRRGGRAHGESREISPEDTRAYPWLTSAGSCPRECQRENIRRLRITRAGKIRAPFPRRVLPARNSRNKARGMLCVVLIKRRIPGALSPPGRVFPGNSIR